MKYLCHLITIAFLIISGESFKLNVVSNIRNWISGDDDGFSENPECLEQDVNEYLDRIILQAREQLDDPMRLPPRSNIVELSEGRAWGLSTLHRSGPSLVKCLDNDTVIVKGRLSVETMKGRYLWESTIAGKEREGYIVIISNDFESSVRIRIPLQKGGNSDSHPVLEEFKIERLKDVTIEMTGMGFLTWSLAKVTTWMSGIFQGALAWGMQKPIKEALEREMAEITLS